MGVAWPATGSLTPLLFIGLAPLLFIEDYIADKKRSGEKVKLLPYAYLTFFIFNVWTTWWVWNASAFGAIMAIVCNSLFTALIFLLFHKTKNVLGNSRGYISLIFYWVAWEYMHHNWDLSWPWLTLGNGLAGLPEWVQWYEYTGTYGGSIWILLANIPAFYLLKAFVEMGSNAIKRTNYLIVLGVLLLIPIGWSYSMYATHSSEGEDIEVVIVQPNIDPYNEKFGSMTSRQQMERILSLAEEKITSTTKYVVAPETAIPKSFEELRFKKTEEYEMIHAFLKKHPNVEFVIGASTFVIYSSDEELSITARKSQDGGFWYDYCNTAVQLNEQGNVQYYHKSKLVPGVETMPFPSFFKHFQDLAFNLGGATGSMGKQDEREVFWSKDSTGIAPVVCYESIYGEYVGEYIANGAELIFIITNDGWWKDTPGYKQHKMYASLRAIEHRRAIARSANTGTSCIINQRGDIGQETEWWVPASINGTVQKNNAQTFYSTYGNYLPRTFLGFSGLLLLFAIGRYVKEKELNKSK